MTSFNRDPITGVCPMDEINGTKENPGTETYGFQQNINVGSCQMYNVINRIVYTVLPRAHWTCTIIVGTHVT